MPNAIVVQNVICCKVLMLPTKYKRLIIMIDGLNYLAWNDPLRKLSWYACLWKHATYMPKGRLHVCTNVCACCVFEVLCASVLLHICTFVHMCLSDSSPQCLV